jgi:hypothetical protein
MDNYLKIVVIAFFGFVCGLFVYDRFLIPQHETVYRETIVTDTTYKHYKEKYQIDSIKSISLSDSIDYYKYRYGKKLKDKNIVIVHDSVFVDKPFLAPLRRFSGQQAFLYGNTYFDATVAGELLDMEITNDFRIPQITNTVTKTTQTVIKPSGLYGTVGFRGDGNNFSTLLGLTYLKDKSLISYSYDLKLKSHQVGVGFKVLGR